jgi:hypothetical protein
LNSVSSKLPLFFNSVWIDYAEFQQNPPVLLTLSPSRTFQTYRS